MPSTLGLAYSETAREGTPDIHVTSPLLARVKTEDRRHMPDQGHVRRRCLRLFARLAKNLKQRALTRGREFRGFSIFWNAESILLWPKNHKNKLRIWQMMLTWFWIIIGSKTLSKEVRPYQSAESVSQIFNGSSSPTTSFSIYFCRGPECPPSSITVHAAVRLPLCEIDCKTSHKSAAAASYQIYRPLHMGSVTVIWSTEPEKSICTWLCEVYWWPFLTLLPDPARVLLSYVLQTFISASVQSIANRAEKN